MLDDLKYIHEKDVQDALGVAEKQWQQYKHDFGFKMATPKDIDNVVIAGMGGSGLAAKAFKVWPGLEVPIEVVQVYDLPDYCTPKTLLVCVSYSGNTEETISVLESAVNEFKEAAQRPVSVVISRGGYLEQLAREQNLPHIVLPSGFQPRMTFGYQLRALVEIFESTSLLGGGLRVLNEAADWLEEQVKNWRPDVPTKDNQAKQIAQELMGKSVVVYSGPQLAPAAYKWKININENAKQIAWWNQYPELNHNEFLGWTQQPVQKPYAVVELRSNLEHERVQKRFKVTDRLLSGQRPAPIVIDPPGETLSKQLLWSIALGDFVSLYLALLNGLNPTPVDLIEKLKAELK